MDKPYLIFLHKIPHFWEKLYCPHSGPRRLSTILVKDSHIFKITESVFSFYLKFHNFKQVGVFY